MKSKKRFSLRDGQGPAAEAFERTRGPSLAASPAAIEEEQLRLLPMVEVMKHRLRIGEKLPAYLMRALERFHADEWRRREKVAAFNAVLEAQEQGAPLTRDSKGDQDAYHVVAKRFGRTAAWVEKAYGELSRKK